MLFKRIAIVSIVGFTLALQGPAQSKPVSKPAAAAAPSPVDDVIQLVKGGMSESFIIKSLQKQNKPLNLSPADMVKLQKNGVSENIISVMMDPSGAPAPVQVATVAAVPPPTETVAPGPACATPADVSAVANSAKRRVAVSAFEYGAVKTAVTEVAHNDVNIGVGIRSMLLTKMDQSKTVVVLERENIKDLMQEQDFGTSNRVKQGTQAKVGQLKGADAMLYGTIVTFGRDDKAKKNGAAGALRWIPGVGGAAAVAANAKETDKAVVVINLRLVDAATGEVIDAEEARGESTRTSTNWAAVAGTWRGGAGADSGMTSKDFGETIIGEATQDAVNKIAAILERKMGDVAARSRTIEGRIAVFNGCTITLNIGGNDGVQVGDHFEIHKILNPVIDPETKEVIDKETVRVGDFVASTVRDKVSIGQYGGEPLSSTYAKGYAARMVTK